MSGDKNDNSNRCDSRWIELDNDLLARIMEIEMKRKKTVVMCNKARNSMVFLIPRKHSKTKYYVLDRSSGITTEKGDHYDMDISQSIDHFNKMGSIRNG